MNTICKWKHLSLYFKNWAEIDSASFVLNWSNTKRFSRKQKTIKKTFYARIQKHLSKQKWALFLPFRTATFEQIRIGFRRALLVRTVTREQPTAWQIALHRNHLRSKWRAVPKKVLTNRVTVNKDVKVNNSTQQITFRFPQSKVVFKLFLWNIALDSLYFWILLVPPPLR